MTRQDRLAELERRVERLEAAWPGARGDLGQVTVGPRHDWHEVVAIMTRPDGSRSGGLYVCPICEARIESDDGEHWRVVYPAGGSVTSKSRHRTDDAPQAPTGGDDATLG